MEIKDLVAFATENARITDVPGIISFGTQGIDFVPYVQVTEGWFRENIHRLGTHRFDFTCEGWKGYEYQVVIDGVIFCCLSKEENLYA